MANPYAPSNKPVETTLLEDTLDVINHSWYGQYVQKEELINQLGVDTNFRDPTGKKTTQATKNKTNGLLNKIY